MQDLQQKLESAAKELVEVLALNCAGRDVKVFTGLDIEEQYKPCVTMVALTGNELPQGSGNFTLAFSAVVSTNANDTTIEQHRELCRNALAPLMSDDTEIQLGEAIDDFGVLGIFNRACVERAVDDCFETELNFEAVCLGAALTA